MEHRFKVNSNGNVSREEWNHTVDHFLERFSPRVLSGIFQFLDADGGGDITPEEARGQFDSIDVGGFVSSSMPTGTVAGTLPRRRRGTNSTRST